MEIDEIDLQDELTSDFLVKYLNGEISFHEWLQQQSVDNTEENVLGDESPPKEICDVNIVAAPEEIVGPNHDGVYFIRHFYNKRFISNMWKTLTLCGRYLCHNMILYMVEI